MIFPQYNANAFGFVSVVENRLPRSITGYAKVPCVGSQRYVGPYGYTVQSCEHAGFMQCGVDTCILSRVTCVLNELPESESDDDQAIVPEAASTGIPTLAVTLAAGLVLGYLAHGAIR